MENLILMADQLLLDLMVYERALNCLCSLDAVITCHLRVCEQANVGDNDILLARLATTVAVRDMYDEYRLNKWAEIQSLSGKIEETAASIGYPSFRSLITDVRHVGEAPDQPNSVSDFWLAKESLYFRRD